MPHPRKTPAIRKVLVLDGTPNHLAGFRDIANHLVQVAGDIFPEITRYTLDDLNIAPCLGDFDCWLRTPGLCRTRDEAQDIARAYHDADLVICLTPLVFGGYGAALKGALDRLLGLLHPNFCARAGTTRHFPRYDRYPALLFVGLSEHIDSEASLLFHELAGGNAINLQAPDYRALVLRPQDPAWPARLETTLQEMAEGLPGDPFPFYPPADALARACAPDEVADPGPLPKRVALLMGSPRPRGTSTSESLARGLMAPMAAAGIDCQIIPATAWAKAGPRAEAALAKVTASDLLVVAAPLYVDGLPAALTRALAALSAHRQAGGQLPGRVVGLLNCGYPEASHSRSAMRLLRIFARENGLQWAGGLAMGAGEVLHGRPIGEAGWLFHAQATALRQAGLALAQGLPVPAAAASAMARPVVPAFIYRWVARWRWLTQIRARGMSGKELSARPHDSEVTH